MAIEQHPAPPGRLERSTLVTPAANPAMIEKAARSAADAVCIDLEDAVAPDQKEASRANVVRAFNELDFGPRLRLYRINSLDTPFAYRDLIEVVEGAGASLDLVMVPKVERPEDVHFVATLLGQIEAHQGFANPIGIEAQIETALGCINAPAIAAASPRLEALVFGQGDFAASARMPLDSIGEFDENDALYPGHRWHYVMSQIVTAARAYGKRVIDGPFAGLRDPEGLERACQIARVLGFDGKWCIHPGQIETVNRLFTPSERQVAWARRVLAEYERATAEGRGALAVAGKMIDAASLRLAHTVVGQGGKTTLKAQTNGVNDFLTEIYRMQKRLSSLLADLGFSLQQLEALRRQHLEQIVTGYIALIREHLLTSREDGERMFFIINRRFGLDGNPCATLHGLGQQLSISGERVRQLEQKTLRSCRARKHRQFREEGLRKLASSLVGEAAENAIVSTMEKSAGEKITSLTKLRQSRQRAYEPWSDQEEAELAQLVHSGKSVAAIATLLQRQPSAIISRMQRLNLTEGDKV